MTDAPRDANQPASDIRTELAYRRTSAASDRTLMAWTRTAISLIGFGFSIPTFFHYLAEAHGRDGDEATPGKLGLMLIGVGTVSLVLAAAQHQLELRKLPPMFRRHDWLSLGLLTAAAVVAVGCYAFFAVVTLGPAR